MYGWIRRGEVICYSNPALSVHAIWWSNRLLREVYLDDKTSCISTMGILFAHVNVRERHQMVVSTISQLRVSSDDKDLSPTGPIRMWSSSKSGQGAYALGIAKSPLNWMRVTLSRSPSITTSRVYLTPVEGVVRPWVSPRHSPSLHYYSPSRFNIIPSQHLRACPLMPTSSNRRRSFVV